MVNPSINQIVFNLTKVLGGLPTHHPVRDFNCSCSLQCNFATGSFISGNVSRNVKRSVFFPVSRTRSVAKEYLLKSIVDEKFGQNYPFFDLIVDEAYFDTAPS